MTWSVGEKAGRQAGLLVVILTKLHKGADADVNSSQALLSSEAGVQSVVVVVVVYLCTCVQLPGHCPTDHTYHSLNTTV